MRSLNLQWPLVLFLIVPCFAQNATVSIQANSGILVDNRPFGKYLIEVCSLSDENRVFRCIPTPLAHRLYDKSEISRQALPDQTINLKLVCDPNDKSCKSPQYPLVAGTDFFISATSDSGRMVHQALLSGNATLIGGTNPARYHADSPGSVIIRATQPGDKQFNAGVPGTLILQVNAKASTDSCSVLPAAQPSTNTTLDAASIVTLLGNPTPFILTAQGPNTMAIYSTRIPLLNDKRNDEREILHSFESSIAALAGRSASSLGLGSGKSFTVQLAIPHGAALGDLASRINGLNYNQFTLQDVGNDQIRVTAQAIPDCDTWKGFLTDIRHMAWQLIAEPMSQKLFYLSSSDVVTGFSSFSAPATSTPAPSPSSSTTAASSAASSASPNATISIAQPPGSNIQINSDTTPCVIAGLANGNANACSPTSTTTSSSSSSSATPSATPAPRGAIGMASVAVIAGNVEQIPPDLLVFSDTNPGDDAQIAERLRIIAQLDLPRPEMIMNAWVTQNSSSSPESIGSFTNLVNGIVANYNLEFESVVLNGWASVKAQSSESDYWNESFRSYVEDRFVAQPSLQKPGNSVKEMSQAFLDNSQAAMALPIANNDKIKGPRICPQNRYCLGYLGVFNPPKPTLTDLLITIIASRDPVQVIDSAIASIESGRGSLAQSDAVAFGSHQGQLLMGMTEERVCSIDHEIEGHGQISNRCRAIWDNLDLDNVTLPPFTQRKCADLDYRGTLYSLIQEPAHQPHIHLYCLKEEIHRMLRTAADGHSYGAGLLRAVLADFLYNYKLSQQYPHEFTAYDLTRSADALNNALNPIIDAFNRDITNYQLFVRADMQYQVERLNARTDGRCCVKRLFGLEKPSFFNDGLITVRTISGEATTVSTTSQSLLNVSTAPQLSSLLNNLTGSSAPGSGTGNTPAPKTPLVTDNSVTILANLLSNYQTTAVQLGRSLTLTATPRSLSTASSAEINVSLNADDSGAPTLYSLGGSTSDPAFQTSRVATHDTTTRVRVDSIKLFEISSLTAILERSHSRFPLLPPFVEIPYIGTFMGIPLGAAKEFHNSTAILSAYVVPTAADIAYGLRFVSDLVADGLNQGPCSFYRGSSGPTVKDVCLFRRALSLRDFSSGYGQLNNFNHTMVGCLAHDTASPDCLSITFDDVPHMYQ